jgi:hypothetical protein
MNVAALNQLGQFCNGTSHYYGHTIGRLVYTDGVKFLCENADCYWLLDLIASYQDSAEVRRDEMLRNMQFWTLKVDLENKKGVAICERDTDDVAFSQDIPYTDFPLKEIKLYVGPDTIVCLPSEY